MAAIAGLALTVLNATGANAQSIGINFTAGAQTLAASAQPGVVAGANWNNLIGGAGTNVALNNNSGVVTTALLTFNSAAAFDNGPIVNTPNAATNTMYRGSIFGDNATVSREVSIFLQNIPFAVYDVYVYASSGDTAATNTLSLTNGSTTFYYRNDGTGNAPTSLVRTASTNPNAPTVGNAQYQVFSGQTGSTFTLATGGSVNNVLANSVYGVQIVAVVVPEANTFALALPALGLIGTVLLRRRKSA